MKLRADRAKNGWPPHIAAYAVLTSLAAFTVCKGDPAPARAPESSVLASIYNIPYGIYVPTDDACNDCNRRMGVG
eukprot:5309900-Pyramimonas_sp.AAC.1